MDSRFVSVEMLVLRPFPITNNTIMTPTCLKRDMSISHMQTHAIEHVLLPSTSTPVKTFTSLTPHTLGLSVSMPDMCIMSLSPSSNNDHTSSTASISSNSETSTAANNKSILHRTTPLTRQKCKSRTDSDSSSSSLEESPNSGLSFNASKMKSSDVKNKFTTSHNGHVIRCNRTSGNQRSYIGYQDIKEYFFLPEGEAAKRLGCSKSKLKRIKTRLNIERWPYRRIQSLLNQKQNNLSKNASVEDLELAIQFVVDYPNLITKYSNDDIALTASRFDRVKINNLL